MTRVFSFLLTAYGLGLLVTFAGLYLMAIAQPALLYLVPFTLIPVFVLGLTRRELKILWNGDGQVCVARLNDIRLAIILHFFNSKCRW